MFDTKNRKSVRFQARPSSSDKHSYHEVHEDHEDIAHDVIPAEAGIQADARELRISTFAGMTRYLTHALRAWRNMIEVT
jgi:hypothetical protein